MLIISFFQNLFRFLLILRKGSNFRNLESPYWLIYWLFLKLWYLKFVRQLDIIITEKSGLLYYWILKNYILERALSSKHFPKSSSNPFFMLYIGGLNFFFFFFLSSPFPLSFSPFLAQRSKEGFQVQGGGVRNLFSCQDMGPDTSSSIRVVCFYLHISFEKHLKTMVERQ